MDPTLIKEGVRGCGLRKKGGLYLVSMGKRDGVLPLWVSLHPPIPCEDKMHRGPVIVDGAAILAGLPEDQWFSGSSAKRRQKMRSDEWAIDRFGMTSTMRRRIGVCKGTRGVDEAMEVLFNRVIWNPDALSKYVLLLTEQEVQEIPRVTEHFASLVKSIQQTNEENEAHHLVDAIAAIWRVADNLPPRLRVSIIPNLMRLLVVLGVPEDGMAMKERYS